MEYEHRFQIRLHDVDHAGVMFFARLFVHGHDAYEAFMAALGMELGLLIEGGLRLPIAHAGADYLQPLRHGESIVVAVEVEQLGQSSFTMAYAFRCGEELRARLRTVHVFLDTASGAPAALPESIRQRLQNYSRPFSR